MLGETAQSLNDADSAFFISLQRGGTAIQDKILDRQFIIKYKYAENSQTLSNRVKFVSWYGGYCNFLGFFNFGLNYYYIIIYAPNGGATSLKWSIKPLTWASSF